MHNFGVIGFEISLENLCFEILFLNAPLFRDELPRDYWTHKGFNLISKQISLSFEFKVEWI